MVVRVGECSASSDGHQSRVPVLRQDHVERPACASWFVDRLGPTPQNDRAFSGGVRTSRERQPTG
jgi:hypothetical protein